MEIAGYLAAVFIGVSLGLIGAGGSILTVPVFVYLLHVHPVLATTYSLFVVGSCSLIGSVRAYAKKLIDFHVVLSFGLPSLLSVFLVRHFLLPAIPDHLFSIGELNIDKAVFLMLLFALLMLAAAISMIRSAVKPPVSPGRKERTGWLLVQGLFVGAITGLLGAGGGFLIIPALVLISRLPMKIAVGSSLTIMAISSFFGFFSTLPHYTIHWMQLLVFTGIAIAGIFAGSALSEKIPGQHLKKGFGWFVLAIGLFILVHELFFP
ncbi:sulfite exporter TauE/SafE family protein [Longitalea arenae]|uniref:sulfite exporter TauE/SafE family protein n=1 Tax=Longitalea arenae TaxID=2812558 RepID=UPI001967AC68|nr:sulfite exporter TauE/SafE family protein [Longitalea arenae]